MQNIYDTLAKLNKVATAPEIVKEDSNALMKKGLEDLMKKTKFNKDADYKPFGKGDKDYETGLPKDAKKDKMFDGEEHELYSLMRGGPTDQGMAKLPAKDEIKEKESDVERDDRAEKAGREVKRDAKYDGRDHAGKDGKSVTKDIEYDEKHDKDGMHENAGTLKDAARQGVMARLAELAGVPAQEIEEALGTPQDIADKIMSEDPLEEADVEEGNEFSGNRDAAIKAGKDSFEVDGKTYPVKGDKNESLEEADDDTDMPSKAHIEKMCKDGKTKKEICDMHPNCDQGKLKKMIDDCADHMDEGKMSSKDELAMLKTNVKNPAQSDEAKEKMKARIKELESGLNEEEVTEGFKVGDTVLPKEEGPGQAPGKCIKVEGDKCTVKFADGSEETFAHDELEATDAKNLPEEKVEETTGSGAIADGAGSGKPLFKNASVYESNEIVSRAKQINEDMSFTVSGGQDQEPTLNINASGAEAQQLGQLLKLSGLGMQPAAPQYGEVEIAVAEDQEFANGADDQNTMDTEYMTQDIAGGLNGPKKMAYPKVAGGDNPMSVLGESELNEVGEERLMKLYQEYKAN